MPVVFRKYLVGIAKKKKLQIKIDFQINDFKLHELP